MLLNIHFIYNLKLNIYVFRALYRIVMITHFTENQIYMTLVGDYMKLLDDYKVQ